MSKPDFFCSVCSLDSLNSYRYAESMKLTHVLFAVILATFAVSNGSVAQADDAPVLAVLEYGDGLLAGRADIRARTGLVTAPFANVSRALWVLREGDTLRQKYPPPARFIQLFQLSGNAPQLLCNIVVRYTPGPSGWRPAYLILQQPPVMWDGEKFIPRTGMSTREPVLIVNPVEPTLDGSYHGLSFGLASGPTQIVAWEVQ